MTKLKLLEKYKRATKTVEIKAWNTEVTLKQLSIKEGIEVQSILLDGQDLSKVKDKLQVDIVALTNSTVRTVSYALLEPKMSVKELESMGQDGLDGIQEIKQILDDWDKPKKLEGESSSSN